MKQEEVMTAETMKKFCEFMNECLNMFRKTHELKPNELATALAVFTTIEVCGLAKNNHEESALEEFIEMMRKHMVRIRDSGSLEYAYEQMKKAGAK